MKNKTIWPCAWLLMAVLFVITFTADGHNGVDRFSEGVNLALRRTAHQLLMANGDSTSTIPPVSQVDNATFVIDLDSLFDYDKLPAILQKSLRVHGIDRNYTVAIIDCKKDLVRLGYSAVDLGDSATNIACRGRTREAGCYRLRVTFAPLPKITAAPVDNLAPTDSLGVTPVSQPIATTQSSTNWWLVPFVSIIAVLGFIIWRRGREEEVMAMEPQISPQHTEKFRFGNSVLDMENLLLAVGQVQSKLTYREAKLLKLFAVNTNRILERDFILKSVWEDEGIFVGRSLDVFVSRLRKMLAGDPAVKIAAVHGVGYRMEIVS